MSCCNDHGSGTCARCSQLPSIVPFVSAFRGTLLVLLVGSALAIWLIVRPPGLPSDTSSVVEPLSPQEPELGSSTLTQVEAPTETITFAQPSPASPAPTVVATPAPTPRPAPTSTATPTPTAAAHINANADRRPDLYRAHSTGRRHFGDNRRCLWHNGSCHRRPEWIRLREHNSPDWSDYQHTTT